jgi:hypothetical protein
MPDNHNRTTEEEFANAIVSHLQTVPDRRASYADIIAALPAIINLTSQDRVTSTTRPTEEVWEQRVRNITSHKNSDGNFIKQGKLIDIPSGLALPD